MEAVSFSEMLLSVYKSTLSPLQRQNVLSINRRTVLIFSREDGRGMFLRKVDIYLQIHILPPFSTLKMEALSFSGILYIYKFTYYLNFQY
jgi:hypothetical protein